MARAVLIVVVGRRRRSAPAVQRILTRFGCLIRTRVGIHAGVGDRCSDEGLIILELTGSRKEMLSLAARLRGVPGVTAKLVPVAAKG